MKPIRYRHQHRSATGLWILLLMIVVAELFGYTWCRVRCVELGYDIAEEKKNFQRQTALQKDLKIELARLKSPDRIARIAKTQLGLAIPEPKQVIVIQ